MTTEDDIRIPYKPELYVPREKAESEVQKWLAGNGRLLTITSPPATGKSWFLRWIETLLENKTDSMVFWLDIRDFLDRGPGAYLGASIINPTEQRNWLTKFLENAAISSRCKNIPTYDSSVEIDVLLERFAKAIVDCQPGKNPYLLIEGGDEPTVDTWRLIERQILEPIARTEGWRFIVVLRQDQKLHSPLLKRKEHKLFLGILSEKMMSDNASIAGQKQIENLLTYFSSTSINAAQILAYLPNYNWSHTGINNFLFFNSQKQNARNYISPSKPDFLEQGIYSLTALSSEKVSAIIPILIEISLYLNREWIVEDLSTIANISTKDVWQFIRDLQAYSLVEYIENTNRFRVMGGVWEFIRATLGFGTWAIHVSGDFDEFIVEQFASELAIMLYNANDSENKIQIQEIREGSVTVVIRVPPELLSLLLRFFIQLDPGLQRINILQISPESNYHLPVLQSANLRSLMSCCFDINDLKVMCFDLGVDFDDLAGNKKSVKIISLIKHFQKNGGTAELINYLRRERPDVSWPELI